MNIIKKIIICISFLLFILLIKNVSEVNAASYIWPVGGKNFTDTYIEYSYGRRTYNSSAYDQKFNYAPYEQYYGQTENHYGIDITGTKGETYELVSVCNGEVVATSANIYSWNNPGVNYPDRNKRRSTYDGGGYGNYIIIKDSSNGKCFMYAHLKANSIKLKRGDKVTVGQKIGIMGSSGDSGHMHLHFEVRKNVQSTTINNGKNLVITTGYNVQTEDPTKYIGTSPTLPAERSKLTYSRYNKRRQLNIYFSKPVEIKSIPTLNVKVQNETKSASFLGITNNNTKLSYIINEDDFDIFSFGKMYIELTGGSIVDKDYPNINIDCDIHYQYYIGTLNPYTIKNTHEDIIYNQLGDVDRDGVINACDASIVLSLYSKNSCGYTLSDIEKEQYKRSDVNNDGSVDVIDASLILSYYASVSTGLDIANCKEMIKCDLNKDSKVTSADYNLLNEAINENKYIQLYDLNNDKILNTYDLDYLKTIVKENGNRSI